MFKQIQNRIDQWRLDWQSDIENPENRRQAVRDMNWFDHGILRRYWPNQVEIAPGVWRSNQPSPARLDQLEKIGIRSILSLRHEVHFGSVWLERYECARRGIPLEFLPLNAAMLPSASEIHALNACFARLEKPFLIHCKSGADRAGLASALYLLLQTDATPRDALKQLSLRHIHLRWSKKGVLDYFLEHYRDTHDRTGVGFLDWIDSDYDPVAITKGFNRSRRFNRAKEWQL